MEEYKGKYDDLIKRSFEISFYKKDNYNHFIKKTKILYYVSLKKGKDEFNFLSRSFFGISSMQCL